MTRAALTLSLAVGALAAGCTENTAPGNDREAALEPPARPAEVAAAGAAIQNVDTGLLMPEIMTDADRQNVPETGASTCLFRMTRVGLPVVIYGASAVIKLNGKLVQLPGAGDGLYTADGITVTVRPRGEREEEAGEPFPAEFVLRFQGAPNELGFHGFGEC